MATGTLTPSPYQVTLDINGSPISGAKIYTYVAGTATLVATYTNVGLTVANTNPIIADTSGRWVAFLSPGSSYKFIIKDASDVVLRTQDNISATPASSQALDITGTAGETLTAGYGAYVSDGSGSKTAGLWYLTDATKAYSSLAGTVGVVPATIASGANGTIRVAGIITGLTGLTAGTTYYLSASTPGVLTATAPSTNVRKVGIADTTTSIVLDLNPNVPPVPICDVNGRLTLESGVPISVSDQALKTALYFTPYKGNRVPIYDGTRWTIRTFTELVIAVPATTATNYDVFLYDNAGALTLELVAWVSSTFIFGSGTYTQTRPKQDGMYVKSTNGTTIDATHLYLGTMRTADTGQCSDIGLSKGERFVWNYYNRVRRPMVVRDSTATWAYGTNTYRLMNADAGSNDLMTCVIGVAEITVDLTLSVTVGTASTTTVYVAIGYDDTTQPAAYCRMSPVTGGNYGAVTAALTMQPAIGFHSFAPLEKANAPTTWYGLLTTDIQSGFFGWMEG